VGRAVLHMRMPEHEARAIHKAVKPDDESPPKGFKVRSRVVKDALIYEAAFKYSNPSTLLTLLSVLDEISRIAEMVHSIITRLE